MGVRKGQPYPTNTRLHRRLNGTFAEQAPFVLGTPIFIDIPVAGDDYTRIYFKATQNGQLTFAFLQPALTEVAYDTAPLAAKPTVANVELQADVPVRGESMLRVTFTPAAGPGSVTYADVAHKGV